MLLQKAVYHLDEPEDHPTVVIIIILILLS